MKKSYFAVILTVTCLFGLGTGARAQDTRGVVVNVPFEFVAAGETLPAGTYNISRVSTDSQPGLAIRSYDKGVLLLPTVFDGVRAEQATLGFEHVGDKYFLTKVGTLVGAYTIELPRAMTKVGQIKDQNHGTLSSSGSN
jgi:hypothetical protein